MNPFITRVEKITYLYSLDRSIVPFVTIEPVMEIPDTENCIKKIPMTPSFIDESSDFDLSIDDIISIEITEDKPIVKKLEASEHPHKTIQLATCPVCGKPTIMENGITYCANLSCYAQRHVSILLFASALGLSFADSNRKVFSSLLSRGLVVNPVDLFSLTVEDICSSEISPFEAQVFQQYVHSIRGHITVDQILKGLRVPNLSDSTIKAITDAMAEENLGVKDLTILLSPEFVDKHKDIDWYPWAQFITTHHNAAIIESLGKILYF